MRKIVYIVEEGEHNEGSTIIGVTLDKQLALSIAKKESKHMAFGPPTVDKNEHEEEGYKVIMTYTSSIDSVTVTEYPLLERKGMKENDSKM